MSEHVDVSVLRSLDQPACVLERITRGHMQAGDHHVQPSEDGVVEIKAVFQDVHLRPGQKPKLAAFSSVGLVHRRHRLQLVLEAADIEPIGLKRSP